MEQETFGVPLTDVQEIIRLPKMVEAPMASASLEGLANLRGSVLPIINPRRIFHAEDAIHDDSTRVVVMNNGKPVGFVVDCMARVVTAEPREIEIIDGIRATVDSDLLEGIIRRPDAMILILDTSKLAIEMGGGTARKPSAELREAGAGVEARREVDHICRMNSGKRLVSILMPERRFLNNAIREAIDKAGHAREEDEMAGEKGKAAERLDEEEQFVVFRVADEEYGVPINAAQEIVRRPDQLTRVPTAPPFVEGVVNSRGAMLPVIDQRRRFSLPDLEHNDRERIMVFAVRRVRTGFILDSVSGVLKISQPQISQGAKSPRTRTARSRASPTSLERNG